MEKWRNIVFVTLIVLTLISGCSSKEPNPPGTPNVTQEQAESVAREVYGVTEIEEINLRHLTDDELRMRNEEQSQLTPIYYVVSGVIQDEEVAIYVSSSNSEHHFKKRMF